jgi:hypothetical protein
MTENAYNTTIQSIPAITSVLKRIKLWQWLYEKEKLKSNNNVALKSLLSGLEEIKAYKKYLKLSMNSLNLNNNQNNDHDIDSDFDEILVLNDTLTVQLIQLKCENTLMILDNSVKEFFKNSKDIFELVLFSPNLESNYIEVPYCYMFMYMYVCIDNHIRI